MTVGQAIDRNVESTLPEGTLETLGSFLLVERPLDDVGVGPDLEAPRLVALARPRAEQDDRQAREPGRGADGIG